MKTVSAVYDSYSQAKGAVAEIEKAGVPASDVSLVANKYVSDKYADVTDVSKAGTGAGIGGIVGGGVASLAVGAAAGATAGGLVGALVSAGTSDDHAHVYSESVRRGGTLVSAKVEDASATRIQTILDHYRPIDPVERGNAYRKEGWNTFDPAAPAYKPSQAEIERIRREHDIAA
jgi:uncharacterized membrane protein